MIIYFDNAATTMVRSEAVSVINEAMTEDYGNPSAMHEYGRRALAKMERARCCVADALGAAPGDVYFTSGGTEANNMAILGAAYSRSLIRTVLPSGRAASLSGKPERLHIITSAIEHRAVKAPVKKLESEGWRVTYLAPDKTGRIPADDFAEALCDETVLASIMLVNNETGAVNPIAGYAAGIKRRGLGTVLHTDAVQGFCKIPFTAKSLGADLISVSSHKLHGPKGAGALYAGNGIKLAPLIIGGGQEREKRAGTEALPAIAGFGEAARLGAAELFDTSARVRELRAYTAQLLHDEIPGAAIIGEGGSPFILCISLPGFKAEVLLNYLSSEGIYVSKGAACKKGARSPTLESMGLPNNIIDGALRVSFSRYSTREEAEIFVKVLRKASETLLH